MKTTLKTDFAFYSHLLHEDTFRVVRFEGEEAISKPFRFEVELISRDPSLDLDEILNQRATLEIGSQHGLRKIHGALASFTQGEMLAAELYQYFAVLVPRMWLLSLSKQNQIHQRKSIPQIIEDELLGSITKNSPFSGNIALNSDDLILSLVGDYPEKEYVVQYKESDLDFISRMMEHHGIFYFFEHDGGGEKLVVSDHNADMLVIEGSGEIPYAPLTDALSSQEEASIYGFSRSKFQIPHKLILKDYNYRKPSVEMLVKSQVDSAGVGLMAEYGDHFKTQEEGDQLARVRSEEIKCLQNLFQGQSNHSGICSGHSFVLREHFRLELNQKYVVTQVSHSAAQVQSTGASATIGWDNCSYSYKNTFTAQPYTTPFRPQRITPKQKLYGILNGTIDGEQGGQYPEIDEEGRYKVILHFDISGATPGKASKYIRMAQPSGGQGQGMHFPLRKGTEVVWTCIDGDLDRPIILGAVPNPETQSPVNAENAERSVIATSAGNKIDISDQEGSERIKLSTPFMNTSFQIGAPNGAEAGAILSTAGSVTTVSGAGRSSVEALHTTWTAWTSMKSAGSIKNIAEPTSIGPAAVVGVIGVTLEAAETIRGVVETGLALDQKIAQDPADEANEKLEKAQDETLGKKEAYQAAKGNRTDTAFSNFEAAIENIAAHDEARISEHESDRKKLKHAAKSNKKAANDLESGVNGFVSDGSAIYKAAYDAAAGNIALQTTIEAYYEAVKKEEKLRKDARAKNKIADDKTHEYSEGGTGKTLADVGTGLAAASELTTLVSVAMMLWNKIKGEKETNTQELQWGQGKMVEQSVMPRAPSKHRFTPFGTGTFPYSKKPRKVSENIQGSENNAVLYGEDIAYVWGENVVIQGQTKKFVPDPKKPTPPPPVKGTTTILGEELVLIVSKKIAEIKGKEETLISGKVVDCEADETILLTTKTKNIDIQTKGDDGTIKIISDKKDIKIQSVEDKLELRSKKGSQLLSEEDCITVQSLKAHVSIFAKKGELWGDAKEIQLTSKEKLTVTQGKAKITLEGGNVTIEGGDIKFKASGKLDLGATGNVTISGAQIELK